jgi:hypothetical protein
MAVGFQASIGTRGGFTPYWSIHSTPYAEARGALHVDSSCGIPRGPGVWMPEDYLLGLAWACESFGTRMLQLAREIDSARPLFVVRDVLGGASS